MLVFDGLQKFCLRWQPRRRPAGLFFCCPIHLGHATTLEQAKKLGTYLIVGVYDDQTVNATKGLNYPIANLLAIMACAAKTRTRGSRPNEMATVRYLRRAVAIERR